MWKFCMYLKLVYIIFSYLNVTKVSTEDTNNSSIG